jgi:SAM-dependent methyltransferase
MTAGGYSTRRELDAMRRGLALAPGARVLDLACSAGLYARHLAASGASVVAVDVSKPFLAEGERLARREGVEVRFERADAGSLPFADASFDAIVCGGSLNEFIEPERVLREAARVLRHGAPLWLMYVGRSEALVGRALQGLLRLTGLRFASPAEVHAWCAATGLEPGVTERRGPLVFSTYRRGAGLPPVSASAPGPGWDGPTPLRNRRYNWERHASRDPRR